MEVDKIMDRNERLKMLKEMYKSRDFKGNMYIMGQGAVGPALLYMILKIFKIKQTQITIIDLKHIDQLKGIVSYVVDKSLHEPLEIKLISTHINEHNYKTIFEVDHKLTKDDLIIDCAIEICSIDIMRLCQKYGCCYISSSTELWDYKNVYEPVSYTLYPIIKEIRNFSEELKKSGEINFNAVIDMGCNPGNVNMWAQVGLDMINKHYGTKKTAQELDIRTIHISEYDTQRSSIPKRINEYCNTWASTCEPFYEEGLAPVEMSFGNHEELPDEKYIEILEDNNKYIAFNRLCTETFAHSYTPGYKNYIGSLIRHGENITIGELMSTYQKKDGNKIRTWSPSVYYVYHPTQDTMASLYELKEKNYKYQDNTRLFTNDIIDGCDELGLTFFLGNGDIFWIGSLLDIHEARDIYENIFDEKINATMVQVVGGYLSGIFHILDLNKQKKYNGVMVPEDLPYKEMYKKMKPFFGEFIFKKVTDWDYDMKTRSITFRDYKEKAVNKHPEWTLKDFLVNPEIFGYDIPKTITKQKDIVNKPEEVDKNKGIFQHGKGLDFMNDSTLRMDSYTKRTIDGLIRSKAFYKQFKN
jgi:homospermidine synthase